MFEKLLPLSHSVNAFVRPRIFLPGRICDYFVYCRVSLPDHSSGSPGPISFGDVRVERGRLRASSL